MNFVNKVIDNPLDPLNAGYPCSECQYCKFIGGFYYDNVCLLPKPCDKIKQRAAEEDITDERDGS